MKRLVLSGFALAIAISVGCTQSEPLEKSSGTVQAYGTNGCADGTREGFTNIGTYPGVAGCAGAFSIPGVLSTTTTPACNRAAGNNGVNAAGTGCNIADLCGVGWHVCRNPAELAKYAPLGCDPTIPNTLFFASRQSSTGCNACATGVAVGGSCNGSSCQTGCAQTDLTSNDLYGCGRGLAAQGGSCGLFAASGNTCSSVNWDCGSDGTKEALNARVLNATGGGALCCIDACATDVDCPGVQYCDGSSLTCAPKIANGVTVPNDPVLHTASVCTPVVGAAVCTSGVCDTRDNLCGYANGGASACTVNNAGVVCRSGACGVASGQCVPAVGGCAVDGDCASNQFCNTPTLTCVPKIANGSGLPTVVGHDPVLNGTCSPAAAASACLAAVCDADNLCGYANNVGPCANGNASTVCRSSVCGADLKCGYPNGEGPCNSGNATTVCRSGACSANSTCIAVGGCAVDADCSSNQFCDISVGMCVGKLANGTALPTDQGHTTPVLNGVCNSAAAALVCASGVCDTTDNKCGFSNGQGNCTAQDAQNVCRSGACDPADGKCGQANGGGCAGPDVCRSSVCTGGVCSACGTDADCGNVTSGKVCASTGDAGSACQNGCRGSGGNGCAQGQICSSTTNAIGTCSTALDAGVDARADGSTSDASQTDSSTNDATPRDATASDGSVADGGGVVGDGDLQGGGLGCSTHESDAGTVSLSAFTALLFAVSRRRKRSSL